MASKWSRFLALEAEERRLFLAALAWLPVVRIGLRLAGYRQMQRLLVKNGFAQASRDPDQIEAAQRVGRIINLAAGRRAIQATCLSRSLLTWWFLWRRGIESTVVFGVPVAGQTFTAHAWIEVSGTVVNDAPDVRERFGVLETASPTN